MITLDKAIDITRANWESCAIVKVRDNCPFLPKINGKQTDSNGCPVKDGDYILIDMYEKIDTGIYGHITKIGD